MRIEFIVEKHDGFFKVTERHDGIVMSITRPPRMGALFPSATGRAMMINDLGIIGCVPHQEETQDGTCFSWRE